MKVLNKVVGFVGAGNMASSLISGMISSVPFLSDNFNNPGAMVR